MDGIALAIELAASRVGSYGIGGTAELLDGANILVLPASRSQQPRHKTMHATLDWSFMLLSSSEQRVFNWLSVFVGPFTSKAAVAVVDSTVPQNVFHALASLADKSLIAVSWADGRMFYRLLDTTRSFASQKLLDSGESQAAERCHASYFVDFLKEEAREAAFESDNIASYMPHLGNIRRALMWCFSPVGDAAIGAHLAAHAAPLFLAASLLDECRTWSRQGLDALRETDRGTSLELELQEALAISLMFTGGNVESTRKALARGLEVSAALRATRHQTDLISALYIFLTRQGDIKGALAAVEQSATIVSACGHPSEQAMTQWILASAHHMAGNQAKALSHCESGFKIKTNLAPGQVNFFGYDHKARGLTVYARSLWLRGFPDQACKVIRQGIIEIEKLNHTVSKCVFLLFTAPILLWSGLSDEAIENTNRAVEQTVASSLVPYHAVGLALKGEHLAGSGDPASGVVMLREALKTMDQLRFHIMTLETLRALAEGLVASARAEEALETIGEALARARHGGEALWLPNLLRAQGEILLAQSDADLDAAETVLLGAVEAARSQAATSWELKASVPLARVLAGKGRVSEARSMLAAIYAQFDEGFGTPDLVRARRMLSEWGHIA
jgi:predicted ATPase